MAVDNTVIVLENRASAHSGVEKNEALKMCDSKTIPAASNTCQQRTGLAYLKKKGFVYQLKT